MFKKIFFEQKFFQRGVGLSYTWPGNKENHEINTSRAEEEAPEKIKEALVCIRKQIFEVPFIAFYRKEYVSPWLNVPDLWKVYEYDEKVGFYFYIKSNFFTSVVLVAIKKDKAEESYGAHANLYERMW